MSAPLKTFVAKIISSELYIKAKDSEEAELKYASYFDGDPCPCGEAKCGCCSYEDNNVDHFLEEIDQS